MATRPTAYRGSGGILASMAAVFQNFGRAWLGYALTALVIACITNGIYGIPLWQVADVTLALMLFFVGLIASLTVMAGIIDIVGGEIGVALARIIGLALLVFLPFAAISGYVVYGWLGGGSIAGTSFVYDGFVGLLLHAYELLAKSAGDFLGVIATVKTPEGSATKTDLNRLLDYVMIASVLIAMAGLMIGRTRAAFTADGTLGSNLFPIWRAATMPSFR